VDASLARGPGLEYWFKERRTLVDFRRGRLGRYFDGFAAFLKAKGYSHHGRSAILGRCCQSNALLIDKGLTTCEGLSESFIDAFREAYVENLGAGTDAPRGSIGAALKRLFAYFVGDELPTVSGHKPTLSQCGIDFSERHRSIVPAWQPQPIIRPVLRDERVGFLLSEVDLPRFEVLDSRIIRSLARVKPCSPSRNSPAC
jgi:hypothetical protein